MPSMTEKKIKRLLLFYLIAGIALVYIERCKNFRSGPCTPNLDVFAPILLMATTIVLLLRSAIRAITKHESKYLIMINALAALVLVILFMIL